MRTRGDKLLCALSTRSSEEDDIATLTNYLDLLQMFSLVQLDACLPQVQKTHECLLFSETLYVVTLLLIFHKTGLKDKKQNTRQRKMCLLSTSARQLVSGRDPTCALHPVMALQT